MKNAFVKLIENITVVFMVLWLVNIIGILYGFIPYDYTVEDVIKLIERIF